MATVDVSKDIRDNLRDRRLFYATFCLYCAQLRTFVNPKWTADVIDAVISAVRVLQVFMDPQNGHAPPGLELIGGPSFFILSFGLFGL